VTELPHLFSPVTIGGVTLRNRIFSSGHVPGFAEGGYPTERYRLYHAEKAKGGVGLTIFGGSTSVSPNSPATEWSMIANRDDSIIPHYRALADAVHAHGAKIMTQLTHMGRRGRSDSERWLPLVAPSAIPEPYHREVPHEIEEEQIRQIIRDFGQAVRRCREGGLDGVELSMAHNHLIDQFWSPRLNHRTDAWGGSLENRMRFSLEVLAEIRRVVGREYCVGVRMSADEMLAGGMGPEEMQEIARRLAASGLLDFVNVLGGSADTYPTLAAVVPNMTFPPQPYVHLARAFKETVDLAVLHAAKITDPRDAERLLAEGWLDVVGMTRAQIADPHLANKTREGRLDDIRACSGANFCINRLYTGKSVVCIQNPVIGREKDLAEWRPAAAPGRVLVVGGGPAGMEAARMAALRGHRVTLWEKGERLGGQVAVAALAPSRSGLAKIAGWLEGQVRKLGVEICLGTEATVDATVAFGADVVILATGGRPYRPDLPGFDDPRIVTAADVLLGSGTVGRRVVVLDEDGGEAAPSVADALAASGGSPTGREVEIATPLRVVGETLGDTGFPVMLTRLYGAGVRLTPDVRPVAFEDGRLTLRNVYSGREETREGIDTVVLAVGLRAVDDLYRALKGRVAALHLIGDAMAPRGIHHAILEGTLVGRHV
jgi:mycofactocin system FadH/OYE family oxidoreductase 2